jgi:AcrR family transcriptional regulator
VSSSQPVAYRPAQTRVIDAAVELFTTHGVGATSLQMIADAMGVTKAAVYHQFKSKDEIVIAVVEADMARLEAAVEAGEADAETGQPQAIERLHERLIDLAVENRRMVPMLQSDPVVVRLLAEHEPFRQLMDRLHRLLAGGDGYDPVQVAMLSSAIGGAVVHPLVVDVDDETHRASLIGIARRFLDYPS